MKNNSIQTSSRGHCHLEMTIIYMLQRNYLINKWNISGKQLPKLLKSNEKGKNILSLYTKFMKIKNLELLWHFYSHRSTVRVEGLINSILRTYVSIHNWKIKHIFISHFSLCGLLILIQNFIVPSIHLEACKYETTKREVIKQWCQRNTTN